MTFMLDPQSQLAQVSNIQFRELEESDMEFLQELYATTRAAELAMLPWSDEQKNEFVQMQFEAQHGFYQEQFADSEFWILERAGLKLGRLYLDRRENEFRIVDISLMPNFQGMGLGSQILKAVMADAQSQQLPVTIHVEKNNPAMKLYKRLGFELIEDQGVYDLMQWKAT